MVIEGKHGADIHVREGDGTQFRPADSQKITLCTPASRYHTTIRYQKISFEMAIALLATPIIVAASHLVCAAIA